MVTKHGYSETALFGASENLSFQPQVSKRVSTGTCQNLTSWTVRSAQVRKLVRKESPVLLALKTCQNLSKPDIQNLKKPEA